MRRRNWTQLARYLVDYYDLDFTMNSIQAEWGEMALSFFGAGVQTTADYPNPFQVTLSQSNLSGSVSPGLAFDANGQICRIDPSTAASATFTIPTPDAQNSRYDLLVIRYKQVGNTPIPQPSNPSQTISLNLSDSFTLALIPGAPSQTPSYPAPGALDVVLAGLQVPANATTASRAYLDLSVRNQGSGAQLPPSFQRDVPQGTINGTNKSFTLTYTPQQASSLLLYIDGKLLSPVEYTVSGQQLTLSYAPALGQDLFAFYLKSTSSRLAGYYDSPSGTIDGNNTVFNLTSKPADQNSIFVLVNGRQRSPADWNFIQGIGVNQIQFLNNTQPATGSDLVIWYLVNVSTVSQVAAWQTQTAGQQYRPAVDQITLNQSQVTNKYVNLNHTPSNPSLVQCEVIGNGSQLFGTDYRVSGNMLTWDNLGLDGSLGVGDILKVVYYY